MMEDNSHIANLPLKLCTDVIACAAETVGKNSLPHFQKSSALQDEHNWLLNSLMKSGFVSHPFGSPVSVIQRSLAF